MHLVLWMAPPKDHVKLNFDGSFNPLSKVPGVGGIIRDADGILIPAYTWAIAAGHPLEAELQELTKCIEICISLGLSKVFLEGGSPHIGEKSEKHGNFVLGLYGWVE